MYLKGKRLLVQGAGRGHLGLMRTAKRLGVYTVVTGLPGDYPCIPLADKVCEGNIADPDAILEIARAENVDGAVICCSDTGLRAIGRVCDAMGLCGISERSAVLCSDKKLMKEALVANDVRTARYHTICDSESLEHALRMLEFPLILKATDLQGSRGIYIVRSEIELREAYDEIKKLTRKAYCILEEFIEGREFGAQAFVFHGDVAFVLPHGDETIMCGTAVPVGHYMPVELSAEVEADAIRQAKSAIRALGLDNCAVNIDFIEKEGKAYIIELTGRVGANCLPELTSNYWGIDYYEMIIAMALGEDPLRVFGARSGKPNATVARMVKADNGGIFESAIGVDIDGLSTEWFVRPGSEIRRFTNCNDAIGQIIVIGTDIEDCNRKIEEYLRTLEIKTRL